MKAVLNFKIYILRLFFAFFLGLSFLGCLPAPDKTNNDDSSDDGGISFPNSPSSTIDDDIVGKFLYTPDATTDAMSVYLHSTLNTSGTITSKVDSKSQTATGFSSDFSSVIDYSHVGVDYSFPTVASTSNLLGRQVCLRFYEENTTTIGESKLIIRNNIDCNKISEYPVDPNDFLFASTSLGQESKNKPILAYAYFADPVVIGRTVYVPLPGFTYDMKG